MQFIYGSVGKVNGGECEAISSSVMPRFGEASAIVFDGFTALFGCHQDSRAESKRAVMCGFVTNSSQLRRVGATGETDSDLIVSGYDLLGPSFFDLIHGQFTIAMWDPRAKKLIIARDRMGLYPLYVTSTGEAQFFASDYKSLLALSAVSTTPNLQAIGFFHHSGWVPRGATFIKAISSISPGTVNIIEDTGSRIIHTISLPRFDQVELDIEKNVESVRKELRSAVKDYLPASNVIGTTLSNGIDSTYLAAELAEQCRVGGASLHTFTVGFGETDPEIIGARETAAYLGTVHHEVLIRPTDLSTLWPEAIWHLEDPVGRDQYPCVMALARAAKPIVDKLFYANGPDTTYGGLLDHRAVVLGAKHPKIKVAIEDLLTYQRSSTAPRGRAGAKAISKLGEPNLPSPVIPLPTGTDLTEYINLADNVYDYMVQELEEYDGHLGMKHQLIRSSAGVSALMPLYATNIYKLSSCIPDVHKVTSKENKIVWRKAAGDLLPPHICSRPKGIQHLDYGVEYSDVIDGFARQVLSGQSVIARGILPNDTLKHLLQRPANRAYGPKHLYRIWYAIATEVWCQIFLDQRGRCWAPLDASKM